MTENTESGETSPVDFRELLVRYMRHVSDCEGITFVDRLNTEPASDVRFTTAEIAVLEAIDRELDA